MLFVLLATHTPEVCPTSNAKTREVALKTGRELPNLTKKLGIRLVAGPLVNREHVIVAVVEAEKADAIDKFLVESRLAQWNSVKILPSITLEEGIKELPQQTPIF